MNGLTRAQFSELCRIGGQMANVCFNLGQRHDAPAGVTPSPDVLRSMYDLDRQWRAKVMEIGRTIGEAKKRRAEAAKKPRKRGRR